MVQTKELQHIGWLERVDFPDLDLQGLDAKVDTGARSSSLHCHHIMLLPTQKRVSFFVLDPSHPEYSDRQLEADVSSIRSVRSSNGVSEERIFINTGLFIGGRNFRIELSLTDRSEMRYPVLLGRRFLRGKFVVDVSSKFLF
ncbi:MAG: RimK/LysX family protein [Balneolaceae bacterium]